ncbi:MAG: FAD:protein FMN transferase [Planctomycetota bacterium]
MQVLKGSSPVLLMILISVIINGCRRPSDVQSIRMASGATMGTTYVVKFFDTELNTNQIADLFRQIDAELEQVNRQMSTYDPDSELSKFNASQSADQWIEVSSELAQVVEEALAVGQTTGGAFDVTVGPLVDLWGFGAPGRIDKAPATDAVTQLLANVGQQHLAVRLGSDKPALKKARKELRVDLSAIAKGHAVDRLVILLEDQGIESYFVEVGGEVRVGKAKPDGTAWRVGLESPVVERREIMNVLELEDQALATSGNYRNFFVADGEFYSHTIDPRTGFPVRDRIVSASVIDESCSKADAIATGLMSLGFERGLQVANEQGWAVLLISLQSDGNPELATSTNFNKAVPGFDLEVAGSDNKRQEDVGDLGQ